MSTPTQNPPAPLSAPGPAGSPNQPTGPRPRRNRRGWWVATRRLLLVLAFIGILLRPGFGDRPAPAQVTDLEVLVVVDRTHSMLATDYDGSKARRDGVRADLTALTEALPGARFSLMTFGGVVRTELPFSSDTVAFTTAVDTMSVEGVFEGDGSRIDKPLEDMQETLERADEQYPDRQRIVFILSDGENTAEGDQESFADLAGLVDGGAVLGYGTEAGGTMPVYDPEDQDYKAYETRLITDESTGEDALSKLDEGNLEQVADELGVPYRHRERPGGIEQIADGLDAQLTDDSDESRAKYDITWVFALTALALALLELHASWRGLLTARHGVRRREDPRGKPGKPAKPATPGRRA